MALNPCVEIDGETPRYFDSLGAAIQYAISRATEHRPVEIIDVDDKRFVLLRKGIRFGITLSRDI